MTHEPKPCSVDHCPRPHLADGLCDMHYTRKLLYGSPLKIGEGTISPPPMDAPLQPHKSRKRRLTAEDAKAIIAACKAGNKHIAVAAEYGISPSMVSLIVRRKWTPARAPAPNWRAA